MGSKHTSLRTAKIEVILTVLLAEWTCCISPRMEQAHPLSSDSTKQNEAFHQERPDSLDFGRNSVPAGLAGSHKVVKLELVSIFT